MDRPLPPYTHIPGITPHPLRDPAGHSFVEPRSIADVLSQSTEGEALTSQNLSRQSEFQWGVRLFDAGFYWEAHEAWESLWHRAGRRGVLADYLKGLIKLAAAGVKVREHNASGVERHARRASELFQSVMLHVEQAGNRELASALPSLIAHAERLFHHPPPFPDDRTGKPVTVLSRLPQAVAPTTRP